jgi:hypothetical protein
MQMNPVDAERLEAGFRNPPACAKPRVWWHWMNGNVTKEGARLDLEWMRRVGIGGVQYVDASFEFGTPDDTPRSGQSPVTYLSADWRDALQHSVALGTELGLEFTIDSSPGWSESGGPWVAPQQAMKKLVWSETWVEGGQPFIGKLIQPPATTGYFQNIPLARQGARDDCVEEPTHYADVATIAYRAPLCERPTLSGQPLVTSSAGPIEAPCLCDGDLGTALSLPFGEGDRAWIQFTFTEPQRIQAFTVVLLRPSSWDLLLEPTSGGFLEASDDGRTFRKIIDFGKSRFFESSALQQTVSFQPTVARMYRLVFERPEPTPAEQMGLAAPPLAHNVAQLVLHTGARVHRFEDKAGFSTRQILERDGTVAVALEDAVRTADIMDLTSCMRPDGHLNSTLPPGRWIVLRFGYSLTGRLNTGASSAGRGLEVDKLNRKHVRAYMEAYLAEYERALGRDLMGTQGLRSMLTDSYEAGPQNWTDDMLEQFRQRRGYDARPWLPVLAGRVIESSAMSDRFLWDFRKTLADLMSESHYGEISRCLHERGLARYGESHEHGRAFIGDGMEVKKTADVPMGAIWAAGPPQLTGTVCDIDMRESASVAHIYGKNLVAGESFTALTLGDPPYGFAPENLKPLADRALAMGINHFAIANSVHQPDSTRGPGIGLGPFGQWFTRKETWAELAACWVGYLTRCSYLLQQGQFVADIAYVYGEDTNLTSLFHGSEVPQIPEGYNFDFVSPDALCNEFSTQDERLVTRGGMQYRVLVLDASMRRISVPVLRKIRELVRGGAILVGARATATPSMADDEAEFRAIVGELWPGVAGERPVGAGRVFADLPLAHVLERIQVLPDVSFSGTSTAKLRFVHRSLHGGDIYFICADNACPLAIEPSFRVSGRVPELWRADTGAMAPLSYRVERGRTIVPLQLESQGAVFVVFRDPTSVQSTVRPESGIEVLAPLDGAWDVSFAPDVGAPSHVRFESLHSWTDSVDSGVRYFSGTATYCKTILIRGEWLRAGSRVLLELGSVKNLAEVLVNGRLMGTLWKTPFRLYIGDALHPGENRIEIKVTNLWPNRLIGDKQPGASRVAFATFDPFTADSPLLPSGLLGPVILWAERASA